MEWLNIIFTIYAIFAAFYLYVKYKQSYWDREGVPSVNTMFLLGTSGASLINRIPFIFNFHQVYKELKAKGKFGGLYTFTSPAIMFIDPNLIKTVLVKDYHHFEDRGFYVNEKSDPLTAHLFSLSGSKWKNLRAKLSPTFTSGRMKMMFPIVSGISNQFERVFREQVAKDSTVEIKDLLAKFTMDVIGNCAFGLECNSLKDPNTEFKNYGFQAIYRPSLDGIKQAFLNAFPKVGKFFDMLLLNPEVSEFYMRVVRETVEHREKHSIERNDFMNLLIGLKNSQSESEKLTLNEVAAQAYIFFLGGFETSSTTMMYCLYELALNPDIQEKTREHINQVLQKHNNEFTYEAMMDMPYLEQVINETLRKYPIVTHLLRICKEDYPIPDDKYTVKKGTNVYIHVYSIHRDPEYYPNPDKFDPERFTKEAIASRPQFTFLPFGDGPRICIGLRFAMMQMRVGLVALLQSLKFSPCGMTDIPLEGYPLTMPFLVLEKDAEES
ncbi:probable cytochrome P450 6a23 isoform X2 [Phlebotomus argentipes]|uniref:probable cytochrome P450 6a23 isoform X2 n=1 Tax=Phlebotomus argentipes TaxID=94469 RepID=UPI002893781F|nr:probable cytochrome P450 6a23 isoform X2 [Phlebotomus argentipes]